MVEGSSSLASLWGHRQTHVRKIYNVLVYAQDLCEFWDHNEGLERSIRAYWDAQGIQPVDEVRTSCVPFRLYGDGAEVMSTELRSFALFSFCAFRRSVCGALQHGFPLIYEQKQLEKPDCAPRLR